MFFRLCSYRSGWRILVLLLHVFLPKVGMKGNHLLWRNDLRGCLADILNLVYSFLRRRGYLIHHGSFGNLRHFRGGMEVIATFLTELGIVTIWCITRWTDHNP